MSNTAVLPPSADSRHGDAILDALQAAHRSAQLGAVTKLYSNRGVKNPDGPLAGVPFAAKNLFDVAGHVTRAGSRSTMDNAPASEDAFAIRALEAAGAVLVASTNMDELAYGFSGENAHDGDTNNPRRHGLSAGGSSSGSAALVAAGVVPIALGTDTNGSVRVPAALSGTAGFKPTYGRLSRSGVAPFVDSLDHVGIFAKDVRHLALAYDALQGLDGSDPAQARLEPEPTMSALDIDAPISAARLGGYFSAPLHADVRQAFDDAADALGAHETVMLNRAEAARAASFIITTSEGGQRHLQGVLSHPERYGPLVRDRLRAGAMTPSTWVIRAQKLRRLVTDELHRLLRQTDVLIAPATPCPAFPLGATEWEVDGVSLPIRLGIGMFTQALTLTGVPIAVVSRMGDVEGLPVGVQIIGRPFEEATLLRAAIKLEKAGFHIAPQIVGNADA